MTTQNITIIQCGNFFSSITGHNCPHEEYLCQANVQYTHITPLAVMRTENASTIYRLHTIKKCIRNHIKQQKAMCKTAVLATVLYYMPQPMKTDPLLSYIPLVCTLHGTPINNCILCILHIYTAAYLGHYILH